MTTRDPILIAGYCALLRAAVTLGLFTELERSLRLTQLRRLRGRRRGWRLLAFAAELDHRAYRGAQNHNDLDAGAIASAATDLRVRLRAKLETPDPRWEEVSRLRREAEDYAVKGDMLAALMLHDEADMVAARLSAGWEP